MKPLTYKGYTGSVEKRGWFRSSWGGKVQHIDDEVTYQAPTKEELQEVFEGAVDSYLAACQMLGREPQGGVDNTNT